MALRGTNARRNTRPPCRSRFAACRQCGRRFEPARIMQTASLSNTVPIERTQRRAIAIWLLICCALVFAIVVVGGITRLTRSGLSIVEWQPIAGTIPPLSAADWHDAFAKYQQTPEYAKVNHA